MKVCRSFDGISRDVNSVVTVGSFDGVHLAHREIVREVVHRARMREGRSVLITFDPHPSEVLPDQRKKVSLLTTLDERKRLLGDLQIDTLLVVPFTQEFAAQSPEQFYRLKVVEKVGVSEVVVGYDHMFGRKREAGVHELIRLGREFSFSVFAVHPYEVDGITISSTVIRRALLAGEIEKAARLLGYPYELSGIVVRGDGRGKDLGYPTANLLPESERKILPGNGVYLVGVKMNGDQYFGMMNIGTRPTVKEGDGRTLEVHLFELADDFYGARLELTFLRRLRDEQKFSSVEDLKEQLSRDREESMKLLSEIQKRL